MEHLASVLNLTLTHNKIVYIIVDGKTKTRWEKDYANERNHGNEVCLSGYILYTFHIFLKTHGYQQHTPLASKQ